MTGLKVTLSGIGGIESNSEWESTTSEFYQSVYDDSSDMYDANVAVEITNVQPSTASRGRRLNTKNRALQSADPSVEVTYTHTMSYRSDDPDLTMEQIVQMPLATRDNRDEYVRELKLLDGYEDLTDVSEITMTSDAGDGDKATDGGNKAEETDLPLGAIIGGAGAGAALLILIGGFVYYKKQNKDEENDPAATNTVSTTQDALTGTSGAGTGSSVPTYGEQSVATVDYDYSRAYGGAGAHSLSDAGGTLGSRTRQTAAEDVNPLPGSGNTIFSDDNTFDQAYEDVREELLDIYAPAGKLGVVIDTPNDGAPVVHAVKDSSAIASKVQVGDKLVAVDDEDVRAMTAIKVSKLISRKSNNASRKLTIIRHVANN